MPEAPPPDESCPSAETAEGKWLDCAPRAEEGSAFQEAFDDCDPPFDPPSDDDPLGAREAVEDFEAEAALDLQDAVADPEKDEESENAIAPPVAIHVSWDSAEGEALALALAADPRLARTEISAARGGVEGAAQRFKTRKSPDLLILETTLSGDALLSHLDRLARALNAGADILVIGAVNDIRLMRDLEARGVQEYLIAPVDPGDVAHGICQLYAGVDKSRVIAVVGARGGVGASTLAHNLAWTIAERCEARTLLIDLDLAFGTTEFGFAKSAKPFPVAFETDDLESAAIKVTGRLSLLAAPAKLAHGGKLDASTIEALRTSARRLAPYVVLDLPHEWNAWTRRALSTADDVIVVAGPDLASLRNTDQLLKRLKLERAGASAPIVALSMTGVPQRPEITARDFAEALGDAPGLQLDFDPALFGMCAMRGELVAEAAPNSKPAKALVMLAAALTGRIPVPYKRTRRKDSRKTGLAAKELSRLPCGGGVGDEGRSELLGAAGDSETPSAAHRPSPPSLSPEGIGGLAHEKPDPADTNVLRLSARLRPQRRYDRLAHAYNREQAQRDARLVRQRRVAEVRRRLAAAAAAGLVFGLCGAMWAQKLKDMGALPQANPLIGQLQR